MTSNYRFQPSWEAAEVIRWGTAIEQQEAKRLFPRQFVGIHRRLNELEHEETRQGSESEIAQSLRTIRQHLDRFKELIEPDPTTTDAKLHIALQSHLDKCRVAYLEACNSLRRTQDSELRSRLKALSIAAVRVRHGLSKFSDYVGHEDILQSWDDKWLCDVKPEKHALVMAYYHDSQMYREDLDDEKNFSRELERLSGESYINKQRLYTDLGMDPLTCTDADKRFLDLYTTCHVDDPIATQTQQQETQQQETQQQEIQHQETQRQVIENSLSHSLLPCPASLEDDTVPLFEESLEHSHIRQLLNTQITEVGKALAVVRRAADDLTDSHEHPDDCGFADATKLLDRFKSIVNSGPFTRDEEQHEERMYRLELLRRCVLDSHSQHDCLVDPPLWHRMQALALTAISIREGRDLQHCHAYEDILWSWEPILELAEPEEVGSFMESYHGSLMWQQCLRNVHGSAHEWKDVQKYLDGTKLAPYQYCDASETPHRHASRFETDRLTEPWVLM